MRDDVQHRQKLLKFLRSELSTLRSLNPEWRDAQQIGTVIDGATLRVTDEIGDVEAQSAPPLSDTCPNEKFRSILDDIDEAFVPA